MLAGRLTTLPGAEAPQMREHNHQLQKLINILHFLHNCPAGIRKISAQDGVTPKLNCKLKKCLQFLFLGGSDGMGWQSWLEANAFLLLGNYITCLKIVCFKYKEGRNLMKIDGLY